MYMQLHYVVVLLNNIRTSGFLMKSPYCKKKKRSYQNPQKSRDEGWTLARALTFFCFFFFFFADLFSLQLIHMGNRKKGEDGLTLHGGVGSDKKNREKKIKHLFGDPNSLRLVPPRDNLKKIKMTYPSTVLGSRKKMKSPG